MITYTSTPTLSIHTTNNNSSNNYNSIWNRWLPRIPKLYVINPVTVLYNIVDQRNNGGKTPESTTTTTTTTSSGCGDTTYTCTAYGTRYGHWLCGEERVTICYRDPVVTQSSNVVVPYSNDSNTSGGVVDIEILSYSTAASPYSLFGRFVYPFLRPMQTSFFQSQMDTFQYIAQRTQ
jgi:hypothetical protein